MVCGWFCSGSNNIMKTIPDAIEDIRIILKKIKDVYYKFFEHYGSKMNVYGWNGRWKSRKKGTGYRD